MTIYLDEQNLPPLSSSTLAHSLESKGFLPAVEIRDFPIRDNKVTLYVRWRKWIDRTTHQIICNTFELTANGTRHSKEFASFLKGLLGEMPDYGSLSWTLLSHWRQSVWTAVQRTFKWLPHVESIVPRRRAAVIPGESGTVFEYWQNTHFQRGVIHYYH